MKPKIFISSTILDFEDLRSALKYFLEEYGYEVQMSEYPNFNIDPGTTNFDNCINNLMSSQYFILLIGYRRGHFYAETNISITTMEYRAAKYLIEHGNPLKVITFVRKPIFLLKGDREGLLKHFKDRSLENSQIIKEAGSAIIDDPNYIFDFINEVNKGIKFPGNENPANNWIYEFTSFYEIITALKSSFHISESLEEKRIKKSLIRELEVNYNKFLIPDTKVEDPIRDGIIKAQSLLDYFKENYGSRLLDKDKKPLFIDEPFYFTNKDFGVAYLYSVLTPIQLGIKDIKTSVLDKVIDEGLYFNFNVEKGDYDSSLLTLSLEKLSSQLNTFKNIFYTDIYQKFTDEMNRIATSGEAHRAIIPVSHVVSGVLVSFILKSKTPYLIEAILEGLKNNNYQKLREFDFST